MPHQDAQFLRCGNVPQAGRLVHAHGGEDAAGGVGTDQRVEGLARLLDVLVERVAAVEAGTGDAVARAELDAFS
jgi:hypothetical protein